MICGCSSEISSEIARASIHSSSLIGRSVLEGLIRLTNGHHTGPINIGNPGEFTIRQLAEQVLERINPELPLTYLPLPQDDPLQRQPLIDLARAELGWEPQVPLEAGLGPTISHFRSVLGLESP
jgi:UDP-glucuronate decarboxylase